MRKRHPPITGQEEAIVRLLYPERGAVGCESHMENREHSWIIVQAKKLGIKMNPDARRRMNSRLAVARIRAAETQNAEAPNDEAQEQYGARPIPWPPLSRARDLRVW